MNRETIRNNIRKESINVLIQAIAFVLYYILLILIGFALFVGAIWMTLKIKDIFLEGGITHLRGLIILVVFFLAMWWFCIQIGLYLIKPLFLTTKDTAGDRCEIPENESPKLFEMIREIAEATGNKMPKHVYLTSDVNAGVSYNSLSIWSLFFPGRKNLSIGIGLLQGLNQSELKAILSHEYGHFSQQSMKVGVVIYHLLLVSHGMVEYAKKQKLENMEARESEDYRWYFHLAIYPISGIATITITFFNHIEKRNRKLSRYMEFEADAVACSIASSKSHISALCKTEITSNRYNVYEQMIAKLLQEKNFVKSYFDGYSFIYEQISKNEGLNICPRDTLTHPIGDAALFPSRISIVDGWNTHPSLQERIENAKSFKREYEDINMDSSIAMFETPILDKIGLEHQKYMSKKMEIIVEWEKPFSHEEFTQWALNADSEPY